MPKQKRKTKLHPPVISVFINKTVRKGLLKRSMENPAGELTKADVVSYLGVKHRYEPPTYQESVYELVQYNVLVPNKSWHRFKVNGQSLKVRRGY